MILLLLPFCSSFIEGGYSLYPPYYLTGLREVCNWTLIGSAVNLKKSIRLTSNLKNQFGGVCSRVPTHFQNWTATIDLSCYGGKKWGNGFSIFFTRNVCPDETFQYDGYAIYLSANETNIDGESPIFFEDLSKIQTKNIKPIGYAKIRSDTKNNLKINIRKTGNVVLLETTQGNAFQRLFEKEIDDFPDFGYFSISASTGDTSDIHELNSFTLYQMSEGDINHKIGDIENVNHEIIEKSKITRRKMKRERRTKMPEITKYLEMMNKTKKLSGGQFNLSDAIKLVNEMRIRAVETITNDEFQDFFKQNLKAILKVVHRKITMEVESFEEISNDISSLWSSLRKNLKKIEYFASKEMEDFKKDMINKVILSKLEEIDPHILNVYIKDQKQTEQTKLPMVFLTICIIEFILYIVFFIWKRKETKGFKKID